MSNYGPPGGPYPGQPSQPWPDGQPPESYGQPADPWGGQDPWGGNPTSTPPGASGSPSDHGGYHGSGYPGSDASPGYQPDPGYGPPYAPGHPDPAWAQPGGGQDPAWGPPGGPAAPPVGPGRRNGLVIGVLVTLAVLVCGGGATAFYLFGMDHPKTATQSSTTPTGGPSAGQPPASAGPQATTPAPNSSTDARFVKTGQCVRNEGDAEKPQLAITACAPKTYEVLQRFDGATNGASDAKAKCSKVEGYTDWYFFNSELDGLDFVLCLKLR